MSRSYSLRLSRQKTLYEKKPNQWVGEISLFCRFLFIDSFDSVFVRILNFVAVYIFVE